ncbi:MAG: SIMPL domain-containing protein [Candidatus Nanopelagicales bacterium]
MSKHGLQVTGVGRAGAVPDVMVLDAGVEVVAADPGAAYQAATAALAGLRRAAVDAGIAERDLRTSQVLLHPVHDRDGAVSGHQASLGLAIVVRDLSGSGAIIDSVTAGAGEHARLHGIRLEHSDPEVLSEEARRLAFVDARTRAGELAALAGRPLGRCVWVAEGGDASPRPAFRAMAAEMAVDPGQVEQTVTLATRWEFAD